MVGKCIHQRRSCQVRRRFERGLAAISLDLRSGGVEYPLLEMPCVQGFTSSWALCGIVASWYRKASWMVMQRKTKTGMSLMVHNQIAQYLAWNVIAGRRWDSDANVSPLLFLQCIIYLFLQYINISMILSYNWLSCITYFVILIHQCLSATPCPIRASPKNSAVHVTVTKTFWCRYVLVLCR